MSINWIVFNGPPRSGKSSAASWLRRVMEHAYEVTHKQQHVPNRIIVDSMDAPIRHFIATAFGHKFQEMRLDLPLAELQGYDMASWVNMLKAESEKWYGDDVFGRLLVRRVLRLIPKPDWVIVDDGKPEQEGIVFERPIIINIHRGHIPNPLPTWWKAASWVIDNSKNHDFMYEQITKLGREIVAADLKWKHL